MSEMSPFYFGDAISVTEDMKNFIKKMKDKEEKIYLSDLPSIMREPIEKFFSEKKRFVSALVTELKSCFDIDSEKSLISVYGNIDDASITTTSAVNGAELWGSKVKIGKTSTKVEGYVKDQELFDSSKVSFKPKIIERIQLTIDKEGKLDHWEMSELMSIIFEEFPLSLNDVCYLPSARSGIMQSHRIIASSVMAQSTRAGLDSLEGPLTFPAMTADFLSRLIAYDSRDRISRLPEWRRRPYIAGIPMRWKRREQSKGIKEVSSELEETTLEGSVSSKISKHSGYPEFFYRPIGMQENIRMNRVSSMVSELSPLVLFIRGNVCEGDTLIVEEPEAHLHPAAQTKIAIALAKLVRLGVKVVITTHSDWLLKEIGNLIREGDLAEKQGEFETSSPSALRPRDVGAWLFHRDSLKNGSTVSEIEFDSIEGIEPSDYEDVAERLYNRSARLQDEYEELSKSESKK